MADDAGAENLLELTADVVSAYVSNNPMPAGALSELIGSVHLSLARLASGAQVAEAAAPVPAVPVKKSITPDYLICLDDGRKFKSLKRHLNSQYGMTPQEYRQKWGLPSSYPMVAPNYAATRSELAMTMGLGRKLASAADPAPGAKVAKANRKASVALSTSRPASKTAPAKSKSSTTAKAAKGSGKSANGK
jgi:predicted transcriptional regulator